MTERYEGATRVDTRTEHQPREFGPSGAVSGDGHWEWLAPREPGDRVRWGAIWAGALTALTTFIVLQLLLFSVDVLEVGFDTGAATSIINGLIGLLAFFLGGLAAASSSIRPGAGGGMRQGAVVWALTVTGIFFFALFGGVLLGAVGNVVTQLGILGQRAPAALVTTDLVQNTAGWTVLFLGAWVIAAVLGGLVGSAGSKKEPKQEPRDVSHAR